MPRIPKREVTLTPDHPQYRVAMRVAFEKTYGPVAIDRSFPPRGVDIAWTPLPLPVERLLYVRFSVVHHGPDIADYWRRVEHAERGTVLVLAYSRFLACPCYDGCLALACREDWPAFTCDGCYGFKAALADTKAWPPRAENPVSWTPGEIRDFLKAVQGLVKEERAPRRTHSNASHGELAE